MMAHLIQSHRGYYFILRSLKSICHPGNTEIKLSSRSRGDVEVCRSDEDGEEGEGGVEEMGGEGKGGAEGRGREGMSGSEGKG
ncbi:hypothetical protein Pmani_030603 [Petrolisthes manimaculis]|uniref:Uncharacterized protein n=1 Tax=Petrolisthes manimaculis TaxID=1843537 RepID=A0AAE1TSQ8_9EUCA|nr:hypothetical protein Pmani_030603 [Petrolisthes manimaculis]